MSENRTETAERITQIESEMRKMYEELVTLKKSASHPVQDYIFQNAERGTVRLSEMFGDREELILVHNMGRRCPMCTLWADGFNGVYPHLADRAAFGLVSPDMPEVQKEFAEGRGWRFPLYSDADKSFTRDMGFSFDRDEKTYVLPGLSTFRRNADGGIERTAHDFFGPGDPYGLVYPAFDLLAGGVGEWFPSFTYNGKQSDN